MIGELKTFANEYIRNMELLIENLKGKTVVFDFDGVMTRFKYAPDRLLPCRDDDLYEYSKTKSIYDNAVFTKTMQYVIKKLNPEDVYVLTVTVDTLKAAKTAKILENFDVRKEQILHCPSSSVKNEYLRNIHNITGKEIIFIEDMAKTLLNAEEELDFVRGYHISSLLP